MTGREGMLTISPVLRRAVLEQRSNGVRLYVIARRLDVHPSLLSHLLNGSIPIRENDPRVLKLASALGVPADQAFAEIEAPIKPEQAGSVAVPIDANTLPLVLFDADLCALLGISQRTLKRRRRLKTFPIVELPAIDRRHRYGRADVLAFINRAKSNS